MKSIARRDTQEGYTGYSKRLAEAAEGEATDAAGLVRMDRKRAKTMSNQERISLADPEAEITRLKDRRTALAYKAAGRRHLTVAPFWRLPFMPARRLTRKPTANRL